MTGSLTDWTGRDDRPLVYLAGPYTHPDPVENVHKVCKVADEVLRLGAIPFIPHLTMLYHLVSPRPAEFWYEYDLHILRRCDAVVRLLGESVGADREVAEAHRLGIPVVDEVAGMVEWLRDKREPWTEETCDEIIRHIREVQGV